MNKTININSIERATLLSVDEYEKYKKEIPLLSGKSWWLRSPGFNDEYAACVSSRSFGSFVSYPLGVRPALQISNPESFQSGEKFSFGENTFTYLGEGFAICTKSIGNCAFRKNYKANDANNYEASDVKKYVDAWYEKQLSIEQNRDKINYYMENYDLSEKSAITLFKMREETALRVENTFSSLSEIAEWYLNNEVGTLDTFVAIALDMEKLGKTLVEHLEDLVYLGEHGNENSENSQEKTKFSLYAQVSEDDRWDLVLEDIKKEELDL